MKKILILGASGFVGRNFLKRCSKFPKVKFYCISRTRNTKVIEGLNITWVHGDLSQSDFRSDIFSVKWDQVFNFFWSGLPARDASNNEWNYQVTLSIFDFIKKNNSIINTLGSGLEFSVSNHAQDDESTLFSFENFAITKQKLHKYLIDQNIEHRWIRPFYIYGKWQNSKSLLASIFIANKKGTEFKSQRGADVHDFICIEDFTQAIANFVNKKMKSTVYNVGSGTLTNVNTFVKAAKCAINNSEFIDSKPYKFTKGIYSSNKNIIQDYDWKPKYDGASGIYRYVMENKKELASCFEIGLPQN